MYSKNHASICRAGNRGSLLCLCNFRRKTHFLSGNEGSVVWIRSCLLILAGGCISLWVSVCSDCLSIFWKALCSCGKVTHTRIQANGTLTLCTASRKDPKGRKCQLSTDVSSLAPCSGQALSVFLFCIMKTGAPGTPGLAKAVRARVTAAPFVN